MHIRDDAAKLHKLCTDVAFFLNVGEESPVWEHKVSADEDTANYPNQPIQHTKIPECQITLRIESYGSKKGRVEISGNFHMQLNGRLQFIDVRSWIGYPTSDYAALPSISCAPSKTPEQIAKDIKRRFLPEYMPLLEKAIAKRNLWEDNHNKTRANLLELLRIVAIDADERLQRAEKNREDISEVSSYSNDGAYASICASSEGCSELKLHNLTMDQARRVLAIVAEKRTEVV